MADISARWRTLLWLCVGMQQLVPREVLGTMKAAKAFEWAEQYPKLCGDCNRAWHAVVSLHYHARKGTASGLKFVEAHPLKSVEEFNQFSIAYSGREAKPEPEQQQEPESDPEEE
jgi:hypothetical protein